MPCSCIAGGGGSSFSLGSHSSCSLFPYNRTPGWGQGVSKSTELGEVTGQVPAGPLTNANPSYWCVYQKGCLEDARGQPHALPRRRSTVSRRSSSHHALSLTLENRIHPSIFLGHLRSEHTYTYACSPDEFLHSFAVHQLQCGGTGA